MWLNVKEMTKHWKIDDGPPKCTVLMPQRSTPETFYVTLTIFTFGYSLIINSRLLTGHRDHAFVTGDYRTFILALCSDSVWRSLLRSGACCEFVFGCTKIRLSREKWLRLTEGLFRSAADHSCTNGALNVSQTSTRACVPTQTRSTRSSGLGGARFYPVAENQAKFLQEVFFNEKKLPYAVKNTIKTRCHLNFL